jgi:hypothetical protein
MSRGITAGLETALAGSSFTPVLFAELEFSSVTYNLSDLDRNIVWNSKTWLGNGLLRPVRGITETSDLTATGCQITLSGVDQTLIGVVLSQSAQSKKGRLWLGCLNSSGAVIADPYLIFEGDLDMPEIIDSGKQSQIVITYESDLMILERSSELRFTQETQRRFYPTDKGFEYVPDMASTKPFWGRAGKPPPVTKAKKKNPKKEKNR